MNTFSSSTAPWLTLRRGALALIAAGALMPFAASAQGKEPIVIGQTIPTTGLMGDVTSGIRGGQQIAIDEANRKGGVNGRRIKLVVLDDGFDAKRAVDNARQLVEQDGAVALFGASGTAVTSAVLQYLTPKKVPLIAAYTGTPTLRSNEFPYFFTTQGSYIEETAQIQRNLVTIQKKNIALVYQNDPFGKGLAAINERTATATGAQIVTSQMLDATGSNAGAIAQAVAASKAQAVVLVAEGAKVVAAIKALKAASGLPIYTYSLSISQAAVKALGKDAQGVAVVRATPYPWNMGTALAREFNIQAKKAGKPVDYDHYLGYINGRVLIEGLRAAGNNVTSEGVIRGMEKLGRLDLGGHVMEYSPSKHHGTTFTEITIIGPNGRYMR